jgi:Fe-S-cluster-containing hydrogenase component 2
MFGEINPTKSAVKVVSKELGMYTPAICRHCEKAPCADICPTLAITKKKETGAVIIENELCIQCRACVEACPFGAIYIDLDTIEVFKCDLCGGDPLCVKHCTRGALRFLEPEKAFTERRTIMALRQLE